MQLGNILPYPCDCSHVRRGKFEEFDALPTYMLDVYHQYAGADTFGGVKGVEV